MPTLAATVLLVALAAGKYSLLKRGELILHGSLQNIRYSQSVNRWLAAADWIVGNTLRGKAAPGGKLRYPLHCSCCPIQPKEKPLEDLGLDGICLLRKDSSRKWTSAGSRLDPGWRSSREWDVWRRAVPNSPTQGIPHPNPSH